MDKLRFLITKIQWPACGRGSEGLSPAFPGHLLSSEICDKTVAWDPSCPTPGKRAHYTDDITLTRGDLPLPQDTLQTLLEHLQGRGRAGKSRKSRSQAPLSFRGVVWLGKMHTVSEAVTDKVQAHPTPKTVRCKGSGGLGGLLFPTLHSVSTSKCLVQKGHLWV